MSKELEILKKHLGDVAGRSSFDAKTLSSQISDANDFIGALQVLNMSLKKISKNIKDRITNELSQEEKRNLDAQSSQLIQNCSFMGENLFDNLFTVNIGSQIFSFEIQNPLLILEKSDYNGVLSYIDDKKEEIDSLLDSIAIAIENNSAGFGFDNKASYENFDFTNLFR